MSDYVAHSYCTYVIKDVAGKIVRLRTKSALGEYSGDWFTDNFDPHFNNGRLAVDEGVFIKDQEGDRIIFTYPDTYDFIGIWLYDCHKHNYMPDPGVFPGPGYLHPDWVSLPEDFLPGLIFWRREPQGKL